MHDHRHQGPHLPHGLLHGELKRRWCKLTDEELDACGTNLDLIASHIQQVYGPGTESLREELAHVFRLVADLARLQQPASEETSPLRGAA